MNTYNVIKKPLVTEKSNLDKEMRNTYAFEVQMDADKPIIKKAVEGLFKVKVGKVRTVIVPGKEKRSGQHMVKSQSWKKAIVTLTEGKIELFEGV